MGINLGPSPPLTREELLNYLSERFSGFSLEKRLEWQLKWGTPWRCRVLPNKQERQDYRAECYGTTALEALQKAWEWLKKMDGNAT